MHEDKKVGDSLEREKGKTEMAPQNSSPARRAARRNGEPLLVELAWLVIEGAVLFRRICGILARV